MTRRWAWLLVVATAGCWVAEAAVMRRAGVGWLSSAGLRNAFPFVNLATVVGTLVGAVILSRHPRHGIGRLFCWGQLGVAVGLLMRAVADGIAIGGLTGSSAAGRVADLVATLLGSFFALALLGVLLVLAPDGRITGLRWRAVPVGIAAGYVVFCIAVALTWSHGHTTAGDVVLAVGELLIIAGLVAAAVSLVARLRQATGETRQQLRWVAAAAAVLAVSPVLAASFNLAGRPTPILALVLLQVGYLGVPVATGFAVLRYRLYDIDRLMGGSVVLAVLAVLAFAGYALTVGLIGVGVTTEPSSRWWSVVVFVAVVLAFQPLRDVVRRLADRLVYGSQAMSYEALSQFTRQLARSTGDAPFLPSVAEAAARLVNADHGVVVLYQADGSEVVARWTSGPGSTTGPATETGRRSETPVVHRHVPVGRLEVWLPDTATGATRRRALLGTFAERVAESFANARLEASLREHAEDLDRLNRELDRVRARLLAARDIGRRDVAQRIRREVVEHLRPVAGQVAEAVRVAADDPSDAAAAVDAALRSTTTAIDRLRQITSTVYSRTLEREGLAAALRSEGRHPQVRLTVVGAARWSPAVESALFACSADLLAGLVGDVTMTLDASDDDTAQLTLRFRQPPDDPDWLRTTIERVELLGGRVEPGAADVRVQLPTNDLVEEDEPPVSRPAAAAARS